MVQLGVWEAMMSSDYRRELREGSVVEAVDGSADWTLAARNTA